jgi:hypothetical protein
MRLLKTSSIGLWLGIVLACSPTRTPDQAPVAAESTRLATVAAPDAAASNTAIFPVLRAETLAQAQWSATNWSAGNSFFDLTASQDRAFARIWDGQNGGRLFVTADGGTSWAQIGSADGEMDILSIVALPSGLLAGTWNGLYRSTSGGTSWSALSPTGLPADTAIWSLAKLDTTLFAGTIGHVYKSTDDGATFTEISSGIGAAAVIRSFVASGSAILAASYGDGVFRTTNGGTSWATANGGLTDTRISQLTVMGNKVFAVTLTGVFVSNDSGASWAADSSGLTNINALVALGPDLLAGTEADGVYSSSDSGATWAAFNTGLPTAARIWSLAATNDNVFAATDSGIWRSPLVQNTPPTMATAATASPNPVTGTGTDLSALAADDAGEANLTYTWAASGTPPAAVTFSSNGSNAAKNVTATFSKAGTYTLVVTVRDQPGLTVQSAVTVTVEPTLTSIAVSPTNASIAPLGSQPFVATALDQFAVALTAQPTFTWNVTGGGTVDASGLFTAGAEVGGPYTITAQSGGTSGAATVSIAIPNIGPTISAPAAADPNPVTGSTAVLSVLGDDDSGEPNLIYTWATSGTPPAPVTFGANASNAAKNTIATFTKAGSYTFVVTVADQPGLSTTSQITVTVSQTLTSIVVAPASATVKTAASQQFTATARDQFGANLASQPTLAWAVSGGGTISATGLFTAGAVAGGPYTVTATSGGTSGSASVSVSATPTTVYQINCGGNAVSPFIADQYVSGGTKNSVTNAINTSGVTNPAPQAVYQSERYGASTYTLPNLTAGSQYTVRLHFAEIYWTATGKRKFNVAINGTSVLSSFDIYAAAGAQYKAVLREFTATANASGQIVIALTTVTDNASIEGIEVITSTPNYAPTITTAASASPNPVGGTSAALAVLGDDDGGEANLTYTWATTGTPPAGVTFSVNGSNAAKNTTVTFTKAGSYTLQATVKDAPGLSTTSTVTVTVNQALTSIVLSPTSTSVAPLGTQQFTATARDQFATALATQPSFTWSVSGGGTISSIGLFTAGASAGGPYTVTAASGDIIGTASLTISQPNAGPTIATPAAANPNPVTAATTALSVLGNDDGGEPNLTYTWATTGTPPAAVSFSANGTNAAKATTATFTKAGSYALQVTVKDQGNLTALSAVTVTVNQTLTSIVVSPSTATVSPSATQQFSATARDQFATNLTTQPTFTWSVSGGGTVSSSGLFTAGTTAGGPYTVTAASGGKSGTASVTVAQSTVYQINCGGSAASPYTADQYSSGGTARTVTNSITMTGVTNPAPQAVYQAERYGAVTYTLPSLTAGASYLVRLHFAELYWTATGKRKFNVAINGTTVLSNYDIYAATGAAYKAIVREFTTTANTSGQIVIKLTNVTDNATIEGIQIIRQ